MSDEFTVLSVLRRASELFPEVEIRHGAHRQSYRETYERVVRLAAGLRAAGVAKGTVLGVADWNTPRFVELLYAAAATGSVIYPVNIRLPPEQIAHTIRAAGVEWLFLSSDFRSLAKVLATPDHIVALEPDPAVRWQYEELLTPPAEGGPDVAVRGTDPYSILFTSGTTGLPKAVRYTHEKVLHGALSIAYQLGLYPTPARLGADDVIFPFIPFYHLWAWGSVFHAPYLGARYVLGGRFDPAQARRTIAEEKVTWVNAVPTMVQMLLGEHPGAELKGLKALVGGMTIPSRLANAMHEAGVRFSTIYGGTDMLATSISILPSGFEVPDPADYLRSTTHAVPFVEVRIVRSDGSTAPTGEMGELCLTAPWLPGEYYSDPEKTAASYVGGWFHTGDYGFLTAEGGIRVVDRVKDVIKSGGEWIPSSLVESILSEVPGVEAVAVLGAPDETWGERPVAAVQPRRGVTVSETEVAARLARAVEEGKIQRWWVPERISFVDELPLTSTAKVNKTALRRLLFEKPSLDSDR